MWSLCWRCGIEKSRQEAEARPRSGLASRGGTDDDNGHRCYAMGEILLREKRNSE